MDELSIPLAEALRALRRELLEAIRESKDAELRFALGTVELELQLEISKERGGEGGISFWVLSIGGKGSRTAGTTHTIRLSLTPVAGSDDVLVGSALTERPR
jgi:hypothetical protein